jgi:hypothetical protein
MDYAMIISGASLIITCSMGVVSNNFYSKILFRLIPMAASVILLINGLNNLNII